MTWRLSGVFWIAAVLLAGSTNFVVKHTVQRLDDELNGARRKTIAQQKQIHDLTAEWTYLNQPELLSDLNRRYIGLVAVAPKQIQHSVDDIPLRPVAAPAEIPIEAIPVAAAVRPPAAAPPTPVMAMPASAPAASPIVPVAATSVARVSPAPAAADPVVPAVATTAARVPPPPPTVAPAAAAPVRAPSLDALFAQVAGDR